MITIPAIDLRDGKAVRLVRGNPEDQTVYAEDPVEVAQRFETAGVKMIHVVDLDAALGEGDNRRVIRQICLNVKTPVQVGGGLQSIERIGSVLSAGATRVILGTAAVLDPGLLRDAVATLGDRIVAALDVKGREVMTHGWKQSAGPLDDLLASLAEEGVARFMLTQIDVDGTMAGPDLELYRRAGMLTSRPIIASGGVRNKADLTQLVRAGVEAAIVGKAIYEGTVDLAGVAEL